MTLTTRIATAALAGVVTLTGLAAAPAVARTSVSIEYRDRDYGRDRDYRDYRRDDRRHWNDRRDWRGYDNRYYSRERCWTEYRWDGYRHQRVAVRYCR